MTLDAQLTEAKRIMTNLLQIGHAQEAEIAALREKAASLQEKVASLTSAAEGAEKKASQAAPVIDPARLKRSLDYVEQLGLIPASTKEAAFRDIGEDPTKILNLVDGLAQFVPSMLSPQGHGIPNHLPRDTDSEGSIPWYNR